MSFEWGVDCGTVRNVHVESFAGLISLTGLFSLQLSVVTNANLLVSRQNDSVLKISDFSTSVKTMSLLVFIYSLFISETVVFYRNNVK